MFYFLWCLHLAAGLKVIVCLWPPLIFAVTLYHFVLLSKCFVFTQVPNQNFSQLFYLKFCFIIEYSTLRNDCWHSLLFPHNKTKALLTLHRIPCCKHLNIFFIYLFFSCTRIEKEVKFIFMSQRVTVLHTQTHTKEFLFATKVAFYIAFVTNLKTNDF